MLAMMRTSEMTITPPVPHAKGQIQEGIKYVLSTPVMGAILLMIAIIGMLTYEFQVTLPLIAQVTFNGDARSYAFLTSSMGFGAAVGGHLLCQPKSQLDPETGYARPAVRAGGVVAALMPTLLLTGLAMVFVGIGSINFSSLANSILQLSSSPQMRGRVMSFWTMAFLGTTTIGGPIVGWFSEVTGPRWGLAMGGLAGMAAAVIGGYILRRGQSVKTVTIGQED